LFLDGLVDTLTTATTWIPLYLGLFYLVLKNNDNVQKVLLVLGCAGLCVFLAGSLNDLFVKPWVARWRPSRDPEIAMLVDVVNGYRGGRYGFFSSHAANTFSLAIFFTLLVRSKVLSVAMILWSLLNCWTRLYLGVHFPGDILCGLLWGGVVGTGMWFLHQHIYKKINTQDFYVSTQYTATGYQKSDVDIVICILLLTIVYAILKSCYTLYI
jgi:undecaprenyl-diphosphatase